MGPAAGLGASPASRLGRETIDEPEAQARDALHIIPRLRFGLVAGRTPGRAST